MSILTPVSWGEMIDKYTILAIKTERITDPQKLENVRVELNALSELHGKAHASSPALSALEARLKEINEKLWVIEDRIRDCERNKDFGQQFIDLARSVYFTNDDRAAMKREINLLLGSAIVEEKSYQPY